MKISYLWWGLYLFCFGLVWFWKVALRNFIQNSAVLRGFCYWTQDH